MKTEEIKTSQEILPETDNVQTGTIQEIPPETDNVQIGTTKEILKLAVDLGDQLLRNGGEIYRVEDTILYILHSFGILQCDVYVLANGIFASANENEQDACSIIRHVPDQAVHLGRIAALNQLARDLCDHKCSMEEARKRVEKCAAIPVYSDLVLILMSGLGSGGFCYLFGGTWGDAGIAFFIGMLEQILLAGMSRYKTFHFARNIIASGFVSCSADILMRLGIPMHSGMVIVGGIMLLVPGIAFTTSIRDFHNGDYLSGTIHLLDALATAIGVAIGSCLPLFIRSLVFTI